MPEIIWVYFISVIFIIVFVIFFNYPVFTNKIREGNSNKDTCEYKLKVAGLIPEIPVPRLELFGINILEPIAILVEGINEMIRIINHVIIFIDFIATKFIGCLFYYLLDCYGKILWGLFIGLLQFIRGITTINITNIPQEVYEFLDENVDANLYYLSGVHILHFPTKIQNRCYRILGENRIPCWKSPFGSSKKKEGINNINNNLDQNMSFYKLLMCILGSLFFGLLIYIGIYWIITKLFTPKITCLDDTCK